MTMAKGIMIVDGQRVPFDGEKNVLSVIRKAGIDMPTFCYYSELSVHGACRMCIVENVKTGKIDASCSMEPRDGLEIRTNTARLLRHRRMILELMLASHDCSCTTCAKSGNCRLQALAQRFGVSRVRFPDTRERYEQDNTSLAIFRDPNKCILCGDCVRVCEELQGQGILNHITLGILGFNTLKQGQCPLVVFKPSGAQFGRTEKGVIGKPAVGMALGDSFITLNGLAGISLGERASGQLLQAFRSAEQGRRAVGPARISIIDGAELRSQIFPRFTLARTLFVLPQGFNICLGKIVALARRRQGGVAGVVKADDHQAQGNQKGQRRNKSAHLVAASWFGSLGLGFFSGHGFSFCHDGVGNLTLKVLSALLLAYCMPAAQRWQNSFFCRLISLGMGMEKAARRIHRKLCLRRAESLPLLRQK